MKSHIKHAFNYYLWGYDARIDKRVENQVIRVNRLLAKSRYEAVRQAYTTTNGTHVVSNEEELKFNMNDETLLTAVVVGMRPSCSPADGEGDANLLIILERTKSVQSLTFKKNKILEHDPTALRVVCPRFQKRAVLYALTKRDNSTSLCDAFVIAADEVFFFPEFRNDTDKDVHTRKKTWNEKIRAMMIGETASKRKFDDKIPVLLERNLSANLASFYLAYSAQNDEDGAYCFTAMKTIFDQAMPELQHQPPKNIELFKLMYSDGKLNPSDCIDALKDIQNKWPHAYTAIGDASTLCQVITSFRTLEFDIQYSRLHIFLVMCGRSLKKTSQFSLESNYAAIVGRKPLDFLERVSGYISATGDEASTFASVTIYNDVPSILERFEVAITALQEAHSASGGSISGLVLEPSSTENESDSARLRATAIHTYAMRQLACQIRHSLACAKKDAEDKEAAAQVLESDEDMEMEA